MDKKEILKDYKLCVESREASLLGRKEALAGRGKFGIFGDGKELAQIAMSKVFKKGDIRSGYYRDQTFMMAIGQLTVKNTFSALYGHADLKFEPNTGGRQMQGNFSTHFLNEDGSWKNLTELYNSSCDITTTGGQMPRLLGLAHASKIYREVKLLKDNSLFSKNGNEIAFGTIGNASTSEGLFFETINAAGVIQVPMIISVWDDGYGISVPEKYHTTKHSISQALKGFQRDDKGDGFEIFKVNGWDYLQLIDAYKKAESLARKNHIPSIIHVVELTQPQGHSTSGSHERYKDPQRLQFEKDFDCNKLFRNFILSQNLASEKELLKIESDAIEFVKNQKNQAWEDFQNPLRQERKHAVSLIQQLADNSNSSDSLASVINDLNIISNLSRKNILSASRKAIRLSSDQNSSHRINLKLWLDNYMKTNQIKYSSHLYSQSEFNATNISPLKPSYSSSSPLVDARVIMRDNFDFILQKYPQVVIFGEDVGKIGDVNQGLEGMQKKYGEQRVFDTSIREATIVGQAIGMALRGLRPICEMQYLDYLLYALEILSDDLATLHYRSAGTQKAPLIVRTRGHRLEGIWHSGSPMAGILNLIKGIYFLVPRNMTQASGFYNTVLESDSPAIIVECLNGYRAKEVLPDNIGQHKTPIGVVETLTDGSDITVVSYGSTLKIVLNAVSELNNIGIFPEVIDAQSLIPFDINHDILKSIKKTNRLAIIDEDVPGGASAFILQQIIEQQDAYHFLDSKPLTITAKEHRPAYADDGDYFSKPSVDDIVEQLSALLHEANPKKYPLL